MAAYISGVLPKFLDPFSNKPQPQTIVVNKSSAIDPRSKSTITPGSRSQEETNRTAALGGGDAGLSLDPLGKRGRGAQGQATLLGR